MNSVRRVFASVRLQSSTLAELERQGDGAQRRIQIVGNAESLNLHVRLSAEDAEGRRIGTGGPDFGISGPRHGVWHRWHGPPLPDDREQVERLTLIEHRVDVHDIEDAVNQMLGRDPALHRPPRLAWTNLVKALGEAGIQVTENDLIEAPLTIELMSDVQQELDRP